MRRRDDRAAEFRGDPRDDDVGGTRGNQPYETPRDRRGDNYYDEGGHRGRAEEERRQRDDGFNPAWDDFGEWSVGAEGRGRRRDASRTPLNVTQDEGPREEDEAYYDAASTPQGGDDGRREVVAEREGAAPTATPATPPPATAASVTGERPDGVGAAIQKEVDEGGPAWM